MIIKQTFVVAIVLACLAYFPAVARCQTLGVGASGNPAPPVHIALNVSYDVTVTVTATGYGNYIETANLDKTSGTVTFFYNFSGMSTQGNHTFTVDNEADGAYSWYYGGSDSAHQFTDTAGPIGSWITP